MENPENMKNLNDKELEKVDGGWDIFSPVKEAVKTVANWSYDNLIDPVADATVKAAEWSYDNVIDPAVDALGPNGLKK